jgi:hypothetical protein
VALDEATDMLTVRSRVTSPSGLAALAGAKAGEPIVITWSGFESRANGVRAALPDDGSGLWGSNRFLLRATFVESDAQGRYLTFKTAVPEDSLTTVRALTRGAWASVISPHHPADGIPTFVEADEAGRYLTFRTAVPAESLATVRSLTRRCCRSMRTCRCGSVDRRRCRGRPIVGTASWFRWTRRQAR